MKATTLFAAVLALAAATPASAQHDHRPEGKRDTAWTRYPLLAPGMAKSGERMAAALRPLGIDATEVQVFAAGGPPERRRVAYPVGAEGARIEPAAPKFGNYHWAVARSETADEVRVASTVWYFSNPGPAPTALLQESRNELEIVPERLPREHGAYRESEKWDFSVRFKGAPLPNLPLALETEFGSRVSFVTDSAGRAVVLFPRDFKAGGSEAAGGRHGGPRRAKFVLAAAHEAEGRKYLTAFNYTYSPDPERERSLAWGAAFGLLGMVAATPLLRRRTEKNEQGDGNA